MLDNGGLWRRKFQSTNYSGRFLPGSRPFRVEWDGKGNPAQHFSQTDLLTKLQLQLGQQISLTKVLRVSSLLRYRELNSTDKESPHG